MINENDFVKEDGVFLSSNGKRKVLQAMDEKLRETVYVRGLGRKVSYKHLIRLDVMKKVLLTALT